MSSLSVYILVVAIFLIDNIFPNPDEKIRNSKEVKISNFEFPISFWRKPISVEQY